MTITRSASYTRQSNGLAESMSRTLIESVRTTLLQSGLPKSYWAEALANAVAVKNRIPRDDGKSAYKALTGKKPHTERFKPFGSLSIVHLHERKRRKLDAKTIPCVLLRTLDHRTYRLLNTATRKLVIARHVSLDETKFPGLTLYNEDDESGSETSTEQSNDISVSDADTDGMSSSDESQAHSSVHFQTTDDMPQSSGADSEHDKDTHSGSSDSNRDERYKTVRRYPART
jgi:hypothetical protein